MERQNRGRTCCERLRWRVGESRGGGTRGVGSFGRRPDTLTQRLPVVRYERSWACARRQAVGFPRGVGGVPGRAVRAVEGVARGADAARGGGTGGGAGGDRRGMGDVGAGRGAGDMGGRPGLWAGGGGGAASFFGVEARGTR